MFMKYAITFATISVLANVSSSIDPDDKKDAVYKNQLKRGSTDQQSQIQQQVSSDQLSPVSQNYQQPHYGNNYSPIGQYFPAAAAAPQIYYVKTPQSTTGGSGGGSGGSVQYAPHQNLVKLAYAPVPVAAAAGASPPQAITFQSITSTAKMQYPQYQLAFAQQPVHYAIPFATGALGQYHQQQQQQQQQQQYQHQPNQVVSVSGGYQVLSPSHGTVATPVQYHSHSHQAPAPTLVHPTSISSYVTVPPAPSPATPPKAASPVYYATNSNQLFQSAEYTNPSYHHNYPQISNVQKLIAIPIAQYKPAPPSPIPTAAGATHTPETATSYASFSQQLNHSPSPTAIPASSVKIAAQPHPVAASYIQKLTYAPLATSASAPFPYVNANNGGIHYGTQLFHPTFSKFGYGPVAPPPSSSPKLIYAH